MNRSNYVVRSKHFKKNQNGESKPGRIALFFGAVYIILASIYIIISTQYVAASADSVEVVRLSELQKGLLFVWVTGILMAAFIWIMFTRLNEQQQKIVEQRDALLISERQAIAGMLSSSIAHDINNVLSSLSMAVYLIEQELKLDEKAGKQLAYIHKGHEQLKSLTDRMMKTGRSNIRSTVHTYQLSAILEEALEFSKSHQDVRFCDIEAVCPGDLEMSGYPDLVQQMFFNLLLNSGQAGDGKCHIEIHVKADENAVTLEFHDNGPGIPIEQRDLVFQPFYTTKKDGTGLGMLSISACIEAHGGEINIDRSEELGGAKFTITLPRKVEAEEQSAVA